MSFLNTRFGKFLAPIPLIKKVIGLGATAWFDATETYAKSKIAVDVNDQSGQHMDSTNAAFSFGADGTIGNEPSFSISLVIKPVNIAGRHILERANSGNTEYEYFLWSNSNEIAFRILDQTPANGWIQFVTTKILTVNTNYYHIVVTYDGTQSENGINIYIAEFGVDSSHSAAQAGTASTGGTDYIAMHSIAGGIMKFHDSNAGGGGRSIFDQAIFFNKELSLAEVNELYNAEAGKHHVDLTGSETFYNNIVAWYDFGSIYNPGREYHQPTNAVNVDGVNKYFEIADAQATDFDFSTADSFSMGGWVRLDSTVTGYLITKALNVANYTGYYFGHFTGTPRVLLYGTSGKVADVSATSALTVGQWYHLWMSYNGSGSETGITIYINGVDATGTPAGGDLDSEEINNSENFTIGKDTGGTNRWRGAVDQIQIYNAVIDPGASGIDVYNGGTPLSYSELNPSQKTSLVGHWDFDEQDPAIIGQDKHTTENDLTEISTVEADLVAGVIDARTQYVDLDGSTTELSTTSPFFHGGDGVTNNPFSISVWFNADVTTGGYLATNQVTESEFIFSLVSGSPTLTIYKAGSGGSVFRQRKSDDTVSVSTWYHVVMTFDGTSGATSETGAKIYIDGSEVSSYTDAGSGGFTAMGASATEFGIGVNLLSASNWFNGKMSSFNLWDNDLTSGEVTTLYNLGKDAVLSDYGGSTTNLVAWYDFENSADLGADSFSTNDLTVNGTPTAGPARNTGLDLTEVGISSANAVLGHIEGNAAGFDGVTKWTDRSGNGNDATQTTLANTPKWLENALNTTEDVVTFDGAGDHLVATGLNLAGLSIDTPFALAVIFKTDDITTEAFLFGHQAQVRLSFISGNSYFQLYDQDSHRIQVASGTSQLLLNDWNRLIVWYDGTWTTNGTGSLGMLINGSVTTGTKLEVGTFDNNFNAAGTQSIGGFNGGAQPFGGEILQFLGFNNTALNQAKAETIDAYWVEKYGL